MGYEPRKIQGEEREDKNYWAKPYRIWNNSQIEYDGDERCSPNKTKNDFTTNFNEKNIFSLLRKLINSCIHL